jgi:hypothetical protein
MWRVRVWGGGGAALLAWLLGSSCSGLIERGLPPANPIDDPPPSADPTPAPPIDPQPQPPPLPPYPYSAFAAPARPALPTVRRTDWPRTAIDRFVLAELERVGLAPAEAAEPRALIRRLSLDLRGLPPSPREVQAFLDDGAPDAYERLVDRFLEDPAYGEHRARYWLDYARYADTHGYHFDNYRSIWPYRDWVIRAFNDNLPFDRFTIEQLAGDLLPDSNLPQKVATGFNRCAMSTNETGVSDEEYLALYARDRVEAVGAVWLGLTVGCASCHDHKYDPLTQREFYQLAAYFRNTTQGALDGNVEDSPPSIRVPPTMTPTLVSEEAPGPARARILLRGQWDLPGDEVEPGVPAALPPLPPGAPPSRLGLARWLVAPEHPLTARVNVNRFWSQLFGAGLVRTAEDFGAAGEAPSHPALLDWLAVELRESGWDVKALFRLMVTSATYRQAATLTAEKSERDPDNRLLARGPRFRMDAEMIRDLALATSGLLVRQLGGPSVRPYQPAGLWEEVAMEESNTRFYQLDAGEGLFRRSLYTFWKRSAPPPAMEIFNAPSREEPRMRRERTNTPHQALVLLDDTQFVEAARHLGVAAMQAAPDTHGRLDHLARWTLSRPLTDEEQQALAGTVAALLVRYQQAPAAAAALLEVGATSIDPTLPPTEQAAWTMMGSLFFNLDEAMTK